MRTKLALLLALCRGADLLVLDEPTTGLDPAATEDVLQALVGHAAERGTTVFFSSHQIADVEQIADHVAIIDRGRTAVAGGLDDLRQNYRRIQLVFDGDAPAYTFQTQGRGARQALGPRDDGAVERRHRRRARRGARAQPGVDRQRAGHAEGHLSRHRRRGGLTHALAARVSRNPLALPDRPGRPAHQRRLRRARLSAGRRPSRRA